MLSEHRFSKRACVILLIISEIWHFKQNIDCCNRVNHIYVDDGVIVTKKLFA